MKTLLFIGSNPRVAAAVREMSELCGTRLVHANMRCARRLLDRPARFGAMVIELSPWLSMMALLMDFAERFDDLPILAVTNDACGRMLAEAYGARAAMPKAHLDGIGLAQSFGWSTHSALPAPSFPRAENENLTGSRKSLGASLVPASRPSRESFRTSAFTKTRRRTPTRSLASQDNKLATQHL